MSKLENVQGFEPSLLKRLGEENEVSSINYVGFFFFSKFHGNTTASFFPSRFSGDTKIKQKQLGHSALTVFHHGAPETQTVI